MAYTQGGTFAALEVKRSRAPELLRRANVVACGVGFKEKDGVLTDEPCVVVSVTKKLPPDQLSSKDLVPQSLDGVRTDVREVGIIRALQQSPKDRWRPAPGGVSIGHPLVTAGTLGCLVRRGSDIFILSNNHVLAAINQGNAGDPILQPGPYDGGTPSDQIAVLSEWIPLRFETEEPECNIATAAAAIMNAIAQATGSQHRLQAVRQAPAINQVDCAIARVLSPDLVRYDILNIGIPKGMREATLGMSVQKMGRTTGYTRGRIQQIDVTVQVDYNGRKAIFEGQFMAEGMSAGGDSGSLVLDEEGYAVGLLFAGSELATLINPIQLVLQALNIELITA